MIEYKGKKRRFVPYFFWANVIMLVLTGVFVLMGNEWPRSTYLIVINIVLFASLLRRNRLVSFELFEKEGIVKVEIERWFNTGWKLEYPIGDLEVKMEVDQRGVLFSKRDIFRIYVNGDKLVEVLPNDKGWPVDTLMQIVGEVGRYKSSIGKVVIE